MYAKPNILCFYQKCLHDVVVETVCSHWNVVHLKFHLKVQQSLLAKYIISYIYINCVSIKYLISLDTANIWYFHLRTGKLDFPHNFFSTPRTVFPLILFTQMIYKQGVFFKYWIFLPWTWEIALFWCFLYNWE